MAKTTLPYQSLRALERNTIWRALPLVGLISILLAICFAVAALSVGLVSDGIPQDSWKVQGHVVQPSVLLSLSATLGNTVLRVAFTQGLAITWWSYAHSGVSIDKLVAMSDQLYAYRSLFRLSNGSMVTIVSLAMLLLLADGPFLQRASTVRSETREQTQTISVPVSQSPLTKGATGVITTHDGYQANIYTPAFAQVVQQYNSRSSYSISGLQLPGITTSTLLAPGWDVQCQNGSSPYRLISEAESSFPRQNPPYTPPPLSQTMFLIDTTINGTGVDGYQIQLYTSYKSTPGGNGTMLWRACNLREALIRYPISIENGAVSLQSMPPSENRTEQLVMRTFETGGWGGMTMPILRI